MNENSILIDQAIYTVLKNVKQQQILKKIISHLNLFQKKRIAYIVITLSEKQRTINKHGQQSNFVPTNIIYTTNDGVLKNNIWNYTQIENAYSAESAFLRIMVRILAALKNIVPHHVG